MCSWARSDVCARALGARGGALAGSDWGPEMGRQGGSEHQRGVGISWVRLKARASQRGSSTPCGWRTVMARGGVPNEALHGTKRQASGWSARRSRWCHLNEFGASSPCVMDQRRDRPSGELGKNQTRGWSTTRWSKLVQGDVQGMRAHLLMRFQGWGMVRIGGAASTSCEQ